MAVAVVISTKQILFANAPGPLRMVIRPSDTVTVAVPSTHRVALLDVPLTVSTPSTAIRYVLSKYAGSPATARTR